MDYEKAIPRILKLRAMMEKDEASLDELRELYELLKACPRRRQRPVYGRTKPAENEEGRG